MSNRSITTTINYTVPPEKLPPGGLHLDLLDPDAATAVQRPEVIDPRQVEVRNARLGDVPPSFDANGFTLIRAATSVRDFRDSDDVGQVYYREIKELLTTVFGADEVAIFSHVVRSDDAYVQQQHHDSATQSGRTLRTPAMSAHVDFDRASVEAFVSEIYGADRATSLRKKRFANINLWRGINPVERMPLAVCDASTVRENDLIPIEMMNPVGPPAEKKYGLNLAYSSGHRWYYYPLMAADEILVFKIFDSATPQALCTPHTAIVDPTSAPDAAPRESVEIRTLCFFPE